MDDLLASIKRAIHDEGLDVSETNPDVEGGGLLDPGEAAPRESSATERTPPLNSRRLPERPKDQRSADSKEIVALRNKISRELGRDEPTSAITAAPAVKQLPSLQLPTAPQPTSVFKNLLGGDEHQEPPQLSANSVSQHLRPSIADNAETSPEYLKPHAQGRPAVLPTAPRRPAPAHPLRSAIDLPGRNGNTYRPPFGQSSLGIRNFQPPPKPASDGMISPQTSNVTAGSFSRLAEQMFAREGGERSIDDLARELLHPMLKQWLDQNLPRIVEQLVREEIERVARRGGR